MSNKVREPYLWEALLVVVFLMTLMSVTLIVFGGDPQIPLVLSIGFASLIIKRTGMSWKEMEEGIVASITQSMTALLILLIIGMIIASWIQGGIVPSLIYYGLKIISPKVFLVTMLLVASITALATGSSWSTIGTIGIAGMAIGAGLGIPAPMTAGALISGAYFGDKMSPLSDTTNLAPAVSGSNVFEHIRHMVYTTTPSYVISLILFGIIGMRYSADSASSGNIPLILDTLENAFSITPILLIPPILVILMIAYKIPAVPGLFGAAILGSVCAMIFQGTSIGEVIIALYSGYAETTGMEFVDTLLNRGGMDSMLWNFSVGLLAIAFGGIMEKGQILKVLIDRLLLVAKSNGSLILTNVLACIGVNMIAADQYISIVLTGKMYSPAYRKRNLHPKNLSRVLEDSGTLTSPLVPWCTCGAFMSSTLGVATLAYLPYCFLNIINPIVSIIYGYTGFTIEKLDNADSISANESQNISI